MSLNKQLSLVFHAVGIYTFFLVFGIYGEKLSTTKYNGQKYNSALFPAMLQSLGGILVSKFMMDREKIAAEVNNRALIQRYAYLAILGLASVQLGFASLNYLSYPTLIIAKSCKLIPIALMNFLIYRKTLSQKRCVSLALISISVLTFTLFSGQGHSNDGLGILGIPILVASLLLDGVINSIQDYVFEEFKVSAFHMMYHISLFRFLISFTIVILTDNLRYSIVFISRAPGVILDLFLYSTFNVLGQGVIYSMVQSHGSMMLTTVNLTRKMFSILLSLAVFGHNIQNIQVLSIIGVFASIALEMFEPKKAKRTE